jgi:hypothetical protein
MTRQKTSVARKLGNAVLVVLILPIALPLALVALALHFLLRAVLYVLVWLLWIPKGKDVLFVYSDSPIWREYMTSHVLPLVRERAVVLNWSERSKWSPWSLRVSVFRAFGGSREFNPMVVKFQLFRKVKILRYWSAFQDWKRGYTEPVESLNNQLSSML